MRGRLSSLKELLSGAFGLEEAPDPILNRVARARFLGALYLAGASLGSASLAFPHPGDDRIALLCLYAAAFAIGTLLWAGPERLPNATVPVALAGATALITLGISFSGRWEGVYAMYYVWIGLSAFLLLPRGGAYVQLGVIAALYAGVLALVSPPNPYEQWLIATGTVAVAGLLVGSLRGRVERLLAKSRQSERRLSGIMDNAPAVIYAKDREGRYLFVNRQFERLFQVSRGAARGKFDSDIFPADMAEAYGRNDMRVLETRSPLSVEEVAEQDDGLHVYNSTKFLLLDDTGEPYGVCGISTDVTAQKRAGRYFAGQHAVSDVLARAPGLDEAVPAVLEAVGQAMDWDVGEVWLVDRGEDGDEGVLRCAGTWSAADVDAAELVSRTQRLTLPRGAGLAGRAWERSAPVWAVDVALSPDLAGDARAGLAATTGLHGSLAMPLSDGGEVIGAMGFFSRRLAHPDAELIEMLSAMGTQIGQFLSRKRAERQLAHQALHDALTGLPNRNLLMDRLGHALRRSKRHASTVAVLLVDLDHFKVVNDSLGHRAGDELLLALASRLAGAIRATETVARFGTDEFVVLCEDIASEDEAIRIAERIAAEVARPFVIGDDELFLTASIGVALGTGSNAGAESLIRDADAAMHRAKERGRARFELFDERLRRRVMTRLRTENELRRAIVGHELRLFYQPIVALPSCEVAGVEALVRWQHPDRGLVLPDQFIPLAEETGLIAGVGRWVLDEACRQAAAWRREYPDWPDLRVSVNLSARQLEDPDFVETVFGVLRDRGVESIQLGLEITESVLMEDADCPVDALEALRAAGALLILDDFGTGYSSLRYLKRFPLDILKVDRSFVHGLGKGAEDPKLVAAMFEMARALGMAVIAEGVETADQLRYLREMGCDFAQGYHFARPLPAPAITEHLRRNFSSRGADGKRALPAGQGSSPPSRAKRVGATRT